MSRPYSFPSRAVPSRAREEVECPLVGYRLPSARTEVRGSLGSARIAARRRSRAFTLAEMVVVFAIILILLSITLPGISSLWDQRNESQAEITLRGILATARQQAINSDERGLFFCVVDGVQKVYPIERYKLNTDPSPLPASSDYNLGVKEPDVQDRFRIADGAVVTISDPMRVAPRNVVDKDSSGTYIWNDTELTNNDYLINRGDGLERHRNFFTVIFNESGRLVTGRNVIIYDDDMHADEPRSFGLKTGLPIRIINEYQWDEGGGTGTIKTHDLSPTYVAGIIYASGNVGINFPSVDGLMLYNDREFNDPVMTPDQKRDYLLRTGKPFYISRTSGQVVAGPTEENVVP